MFRIVSSREAARRWRYTLRMTDTSEGALAPIKVLLIEDDARLAQLTARYLSSHDLLVTTYSDGAEGLQEAQRRQYDVVLLDLQLPTTDGMSVCRRLRERSSVPIIMVTARGEEVDRVMGLELGADDYVCKPFSSRELLSRIRAAVRRARGETGPAAAKLKVGPLSLDPGRMDARLGGKPLELTTHEFELLHTFAKHAGRVLSREQLLDLTRGAAEEVFDRSVDVHISRLRQKLGDNARRPVLLRTVRGLGYMLTPPEHE